MLQNLTGVDRPQGPVRQDWKRDHNLAHLRAGVDLERRLCFICDCRDFLVARDHLRQRGVLRRHHVHDGRPGRLRAAVAPSVTSRRWRGG